jgi:hypothetical protein
MVNMRHFLSLALLFAVSILLICSQLFLLPSQKSARASGLWYVAPNGDDNNPCQSPAAPCATVNATIDKASAGSTIYAAMGVYTVGSGYEVVIISKSVTLSGGWDTSFSKRSGLSIIDGRQTRRGITIFGGYEVTIQGFDVTNGYGFVGGGITNWGSDLILIHSLVQNNQAVIFGGGIYNDFGTLLIENSQVSGNISFQDGGGISNMADGVLIANNSAIVNNSSNGSGGGIHNFGNLYITNSTISSNTANYSGGGLYTVQESVELSSSTISANSVIGDRQDSLGGGGIFKASEATIIMKNTILADNRVGVGVSSPDCAGGFTSLGYNLIGSTADCTYTQIEGDQIDLDAGLLPLFGYPAYHKLSLASPAIDAGDPVGCTDQLGNLLTSDQRGVSRIGRCDIGAYEYNPAYDPYLTSIPIVFRNFCNDFFDDFSNPSSGWFVGEDEFVLSEYLNGEYRIYTKQPGNYYLFSSQTCDRLSYKVEVDARWVGTPGPSYGILFGILGDFTQFYLFEINTYYQEYALRRFDPTSVFTIVWPTSSAAINPGDANNHLLVTRVGTQIVLEINGTELGTWDDDSISGLTRVGLVTRPYDNAPTSDARFDNFFVANLNQPNPIAVQSNAIERNIYYGRRPFSQQTQWR